MSNTCREAKPVICVSHLGLHLPELRLFGAVHLAVYDQDVRETSDVTCLHLQQATNTHTVPERC